MSCHVPLAIFRPSHLGRSPPYPLRAAHVWGCHTAAGVRLCHLRDASSAFVRSYAEHCVTESAAEWGAGDKPAPFIEYADGMRLTPVVLKLPDGDSGFLDTGGVESAAKRVKGAAQANPVCYVGRLADPRGKFDVAKAKALGVPKGAMYASPPPVL